MEEVLVKAQALSRNGNIGNKPMSPDDHLSGKVLSEEKERNS